MNLVGLSLEQIEKAMAKKDRRELLMIIYHLATCEPMYSPQEVANRRQLSKRQIMRLIKDGRLRSHKLGPTTTRIPTSAIHEWDEKTRV